MGLDYRYNDFLVILVRPGLKVDISGINLARIHHENLVIRGTILLRLSSGLTFTWLGSNISLQRERIGEKNWWSWRSVSRK